MNSLRRFNLLETQHPLEPLTAEEVATAVAVVRAQNVGEQFRFPCVVLHEPPKSVVLNFQTGDPTNREAFLILLDNTTGRTYEAIVSLTEGKVTSWKHIPDVQPNIMPDELGECEAAVKAHPGVPSRYGKAGDYGFGSGDG